MAWIPEASLCLNEKYVASLIFSLMVALAVKKWMIGPPIVPMLVGGDAD